MMALTLNIIARTMFSTDVSGEVEIVRRLMDVVVNLRPGVFDILGLPEWLPRLKPMAYHRAIAEFEALVSRLLAERRSKKIDQADLLSMLLATRDPETGEGMSDKQIRDEILTIFLAGHETTAVALSWTWYLLARHPKAEARLHDELERVLGGRMPNHADLTELKWTRMVIEEVLRLYPPAYRILRTAMGEDRIGGVRVPPGATIDINTYVTHRNPNLWPAPESFRRQWAGDIASPICRLVAAPAFVSVTPSPSQRHKSFLRASRSATGCSSRAGLSNQSGSSRCAPRPVCGPPSSRARGSVNVNYWRLADNPTAPTFVRYWSNSGQTQILAWDGFLLYETSDRLVRISDGQQAQERQSCSNSRCGRGAIRGAARSAEVSRRPSRGVIGDQARW